MLCISSAETASSACGDTLRKNRIYQCAIFMPAVGQVFGMNILLWKIWNADKKR